jgi:hypothetical protein
MTYQFPVIEYLRGSSFNMNIEHGLYLRKIGEWIIPDFQRELVWTVEQKIAFMESLILNLPVGEYALHELPFKKGHNGYEVLDGQQRWSAIFGYVDDEFPVFGYKYSELNEITQRCFKQLAFPLRMIRGLTYEQRLDVYNRLAYGGTPHVTHVETVKPDENPAIYWELFEDKKCIEKEFEVTLTDDVDILFAHYAYEDYNGDAFVLYRQNSKLYAVWGGHCSCHGLEGQWSPEETSVELLVHLMNNKDYRFNQMVSDARQALIDTLTELGADWSKGEK